MSEEDEDFAKGGKIDKEYQVSFFVDVARDSYEQGELETVHSWNSEDYNESNEIFTSKEDLYNFMKEVVERDTLADLQDSDFEVDTVAFAPDVRIYTGVLCKYNAVGRGYYQEYEIASKKEKEMWRKCEMQLFNVMFNFDIKTFAPRQKMEFARGGRMKRQGYNDKLNESLAMRRGRMGSMSQNFRDRRDESKGMEKGMGMRPYSSVSTMDLENKMMLKKGGRLYDNLDIDEGAFTRQAEKRNMTTKELMNKVLENENRYDKKIVKQARLMKNMGN